MLVWITKPTKTECRNENCREKNFKCSRKDKVGLNLQAICDHCLRFTWIDINWPGATSDYMAWVTSDLCHDLEATDLLLEGMCIVGDNAYVKKKYMSVPLKEIVAKYDDAYNFYASQLRITIEQAFGVLVHCWAILRRPLTVPLSKVGPLVMSLCRLHNFCIDCTDRDALRSDNKDAIYSVCFMDALRSHIDNPVEADASLIRLDCSRPRALLHGGNHFMDARHNRAVATERCPIDNILQQVKERQLMRPPTK